MIKSKHLIIYPIDDAGEKYGGIESIIRGQVEYAPSDFKIEIAGITLKSSGLKVGRWHNISFNGREIRFFPLLEIVDPNVRTLIPLFMRFTLALVRWRHRIDFKDRIITFHRIEPAYVLGDIKEKKVLFVHGDIRVFESKFCESRWKRFYKIYFLIEPFFIKQMRRIFVVSQKGCEYYKRKYPGYFDRFQFLPTWYDPQIFRKIENINREKVLRNYSIPDKKQIILFVGRLEMAKDPSLLVESFAIINRTYKDAQLVIVGVGGLESQMRQKVKDLSLIEKVVFLGKRVPCEIAELMNISNVFLLTSGFEGMPRVVLESLACGLPVVTSDVGEVGLVVKDGMSGRIVSSREPKDIAGAVIDVISHPPSVSSCKKIVLPYSQECVLSSFYNEFRKIKDE